MLLRATTLACLLLAAAGGPARGQGAVRQGPAPPGAREFGIARLKYGGGGDWYGNQSSLRNLLAAVRERTSIAVAGSEEAIVEPGSASLFQYPFAFASGHGNIKFSDAEAANLRRWLDAGGFLWVDDDYGMAASVRREMAKLFPDAEMVELPFSHPLFREPYEFPSGLPKVHEHDGGPPRAFGVVRDGRLCVLFSFDCDLGDGLEDESVHKDPAEKREAAARMAVNIVQYALTH
jgi:hypothetical protein